MVFSRLTTAQQYLPYLTVEDCPYCHTTEGEEVAQNPRAVKCNVCGLYRLYPRMSREGQIAMLKEYDNKIDPAQFVPLDKKGANNFYYYDLKCIKREFPEVFPGGKVLDVGTSEGSFMAGLESMGAVAFGLEPNDKIAAIGREKGLAITTGRFDVEGIPGNILAGKFDLVIFRESFYYMCDLCEVFKSLNSCLKPGGGVYLKCSSAESYHSLRDRDYAKRYGFQVAGMPTKQSLTYIFEHEGYRVMNTHYFNHLPFGGRFPFNYGYSLLCRFVKRGTLEEIANKTYYSRVNSRGQGACVILYAKKI